MRELALVMLVGCGSEKAASTAESATATASAPSSRPTTSAAAAASASAAAPSASASASVATDAKGNVKARMASFGMDLKDEATQRDSNPLIMITAYNENPVRADKTYVGKPRLIGGDVLRVGRDGKGTFLVVGSDTSRLTERQRLEIAVSLQGREVHAYLDPEDKVTLDAVAEMQPPKYSFVVCADCSGMTDDVITFTKCAAWFSDDTSATPAASSQPASR